MSLLVFIIVFVIVAIACAVQSAVGFGANLVAMPLVVQIEPDLVPGAILFAGLFMNVLILRRDRQDIDIGSVRSALYGRVLGTAIGVGVLSVLSADALQLVVALGVLLMVAIAGWAGAPKRSMATMLTAGTVSGFTASTAGIGGPPVALLFQDAKGSEVRASMSAFFIVGTLITLIGLALGGRFGVTEFGYGAALIPAAVTGFLLSGPLLPIVDRGFTRPAILLLSTAAAIVLLVRVAVG